MFDELVTSVTNKLRESRAASMVSASGVAREPRGIRQVARFTDEGKITLILVDVNYQ